MTQRALLRNGVVPLQITFDRNLQFDQTKLHLLHDDSSFKMQKNIGPLAPNLKIDDLTYISHQNEKKTEYGPRTREVEKATIR